MNIGIDYDGTITRDPNLWMSIIKLMRVAGHNVYIVTARYPKTVLDGLRIDECYDINKELLDSVNGLYATSRTAKHPYMLSHGINIDIWIDDSPQTIHQNTNSKWDMGAPELCCHFSL